MSVFVYMKYTHISYVRKFEVQLTTCKSNKCLVSLRRSLPSQAIKEKITRKRDLLIKSYTINNLCIKDVNK